MTQKPSDSCQNNHSSVPFVADTDITQNVNGPIVDNQQNNNPDLYFVWPDSGKNPYGQH